MGIRDPLWKAEPIALATVELTLRVKTEKAEFANNDDLDEAV